MATYPKSPLIASVMIRISDHFYNQTVWGAAQVGEKFLEKFEGHEHAQGVSGLDKHFTRVRLTRSRRLFDRFMKLFPEDELEGCVVPEW